MAGLIAALLIQNKCFNNHTEDKLRTILHQVHFPLDKVGEELFCYVAYCLDLIHWQENHSVVKWAGFQRCFNDLIKAKCEIFSGFPTFQRLAFIQVNSCKSVIAMRYNECISRLERVYNGKDIVWNDLLVETDLFKSTDKLEQLLIKFIQITPNGFGAKTAKRATPIMSEEPKQKRPANNPATTSKSSTSFINDKDTFSDLDSMPDTTMLHNYVFSPNISNLQLSEYEVTEQATQNLDNFDQNLFPKSGPVPVREGVPEASSYQFSDVSDSEDDSNKGKPSQNLGNTPHDSSFESLGNQIDTDIVIGAIKAPIDKQVSTISSKLSGLNSSIKSSNTQKVFIQSVINQEKSALECLYNKRYEFSDKIKSLEAELVKAQENLETLKGEITEKETCVSKQEVDLKVIETRIEKDVEQQQQFQTDLDLLQNPSKVNAFLKCQLTSLLKQIE